MKKAREQLISAAIGLFHEKSYARISLRDIGNKANITNSLIYHYFEDKEEILI
jgi:AcrR family transcriptional regulator